MYRLPGLVSRTAAVVATVLEVKRNEGLRNPVKCVSGASVNDLTMSPRSRCLEPFFKACDILLASQSESQEIEPQSSEPQEIDPQSSEPQEIDPQSSEYQASLSRCWPEKLIYSSNPGLLYDGVFCVRNMFLKLGPLIEEMYYISNDDGGLLGPLKRDSPNFFTADGALPITDLNDVKSVINRTRYLKETVAKRKGLACRDFVPVNIGDITIPEAERPKVLGEVAMVWQSSLECNHDSYPPYIGLPRLRQLYAEDLQKRLGLTPDELPGDRVLVASGSIGCQIAIEAHCSFLGSSNMSVDQTHYWKHIDIANSLGVTSTSYDFVVRGDDNYLHLNTDAVNAFGKTGGGVIVLNFGNPFSYSPNKADSGAFIKCIEDWNEANPEKQISVVLDGAYDGFQQADGFTFPSLLLKSKVPSTYVHPRTKEGFATGSRLGDVATNCDDIHEMCVANKSRLGSDSRVEQEVEIKLMQSDSFKKSVLTCFKEVQNRKSYFWSLLNTQVDTLRVDDPKVAIKINQIVDDTTPFYLESGAPYLFLNFESLQQDNLSLTITHIADQFAKEGVVLVSGDCFALDPENPTGFNKSCVRIAFGALDNRCWEEQLERVAQAVQNIVKASVI
ncbi:hypothetical protein DID78_03700 [Candidatus Marinamargulisbacteria bacterium SCGC AG-343-D04]|nr:hypothetical protein DID78_03700 [Candidatus Marinamargulisbacteria bacterium SCGC AG-343-D04]